MYGALSLPHLLILKTDLDGDVNKNDATEILQTEPRTSICTMGVWFVAQLEENQCV